MNALLSTSLSAALPGFLHRRTLLAGLATLAAGLQGCAAS